MFYMNDAVLQNSTANSNFEIQVTGTTNLTTTLNAYAFAAKGHYYGLSDLAADSKPDILDSSSNQIVASSENDDTYLGVES